MWEGMASNLDVTFAMQAADIEVDENGTLDLRACTSTASGRTLSPSGATAAAAPGVKSAGRLPAPEQYQRPQQLPDLTPSPATPPARMSGTGLWTTPSPAAHERRSLRRWVLSRWEVQGYRRSEEGALGRRWRSACLTQGLA